MTSASSSTIPISAASEGYEHFCPDRANRKQFTVAQIAEMQKNEDAEKLRRSNRRRWNE